MKNINIVKSILVVVIIGVAFVFIAPPKTYAAIAFRASASTVVGTAATTLTINVPTGTVNGDVMVANIYMGTSAGSGTITPPAGWTALQNIASTDNFMRVATYYRVASSEPASYTWNSTVASFGASAIVSYSGVDTTNPIDANTGISDNTSSTNHTASSITTANANDTIILFYNTYATGVTWTPPAGYLERLDINNAGSRSMEFDDYTQTAAGATGAQTAVATVAGEGIQFTIALKPLPPAAATTTGNGGYSYNYFYSAGTVTNNSGSTAWYGTAWGNTNVACSSLPNKTDYSTIATGTNNQSIVAYVTASASTTYYFCVYVRDASNNYYYSSTTSSLTTSATPAPAVSIYAAHTIDDTSAYLPAGVNAYGLSATGFFRYGTSNVACSSLASTTTSGSAGANNGTYQPIYVQITGLTPGQIYYYCYQATTTQGTTYSSVTSFTALSTASTGCNMFPSSVLATSANSATVASYMGSSKFTGTRIYQATVNGWTSANYHTAVDNQGATIMLVKNAANNKIYGSYNPTSWNSTGSWTAGAGAFLFSLSDGYKLSQQNYADYMQLGYSAYGPYIGNGPDLGYSSSPLNAAWTNNGGNSYQAPSSKGAFTYLSGTSNPTPSEIEVYKLSTCIQNPPSISSPTSASISYTTATLGGNVTSDGGVTITDRGVCVGTSANPAIGGTCFTTTGTTGVFTVSATGLTQNTLYHYRAYATNAIGTTYTSDTTFTTLAQLATVTTSAPSNLDTQSINFVMTANPNSFGASTGYFRYATGASVACDGAAGTRWPTSGGIAIPDGAGAQTYTQTTSPTLNPGTQYAYCAYDINAYGTASAASSQSFTTPSWTAGCAAPTSGNLSITYSCYFPNSQDGVDAGGTTASTTGNTATLTVPTGKTLNVGTAVPNQKVSFGVLSKPAGSVVVRASGAQLIKGSVWVLDTDNDGYPDSGNPQGVVSVTRPSSAYVRRSWINSNIGNADCNASNANVQVNVANLATDADNDGYTSTGFGTVCVGVTPSTINGRTYYKNTSGSYNQVTSGNYLGTNDCNDANASVYRTGYQDSDGDGYAVNSTPVCLGASTTGYSLSPLGYSDCNDANANIFQNVVVATDADNDGYATSTATSQCVGSSTVINGRTYYKGSGGTYIMIPSGSQLGTSDCCDSAANTYPGSTICYANTNACGSYDYNCTGTATQDCISNYSLAPGSANTQATTSCIYSGSCGTAANASCGLAGYYYACH